MAERERGELTRAELAALIDSTEVAIIAKALDGSIESWNPGAERLYGFSAVEILGRPSELLTPPEYHHEMRVSCERLTRGESVRTFESIGLRKDGSRFDASISLAPIQGSGGHIDGCVAIVRDVSERKRLERELQRRIGELAELDRRKDEFLAMLAHELRNPLAPLQSALEILAMGVADSNMIDWAREVMGRQVDQLARLVDGLLDVSRMMQGRIELQKQPVELATVITRAVEMAQPQIDSRGHRLTVSIAPEPIWIEADPLRMVQVVGNLLNNAAKYSRTPGQIHLSARAEGSQAVIRVADSGVGIPADMLERIFDIFQQVNPTLARSEGGLGIGLTLVRRLVELHGGTIRASSSGAGQGSEFEVRLPAVVRRKLQPAAAAPAQSSEAAGQPIDRHRVLVVEDNLYAAKSFATLLRLDGHDVQIAHDGNQALELAAQFYPDVILLDIGLPGIDGYEVARRLRKMPEFRETQIIALTGYGQPEDRRRSREAGIDHHLVKPVKIDFVRALLARGDTPSAVAPSAPVVAPAPVERPLQA